MKKILFINFGGLGDEILFLPTIKSFSDNFKQVKITLCLETRAKSIEMLTPLIDKIICADIKRKGISKYFEIFKMLVKIWFNRFDIVVASGKSPLMAIILFLTGIKTRIGFKTHNSKTNKLLTSAVELDENKYAAEMLHDLAGALTVADYENPTIYINNYIGLYEILDEDIVKNGYVAIHPGVSNMSMSKNIYKCPDADFWVNLIEKIHDEKNKQVVLLGGPDDKKIIEQISSKTDKFINLYGKTKNILDLAKIIAKSDKFICADSAPMHIGVALNKELIALFGPTNEKKLIPEQDNFHVVTADIKCRPCLWHKRQNNCEHSKCLDIQVDDVLKYI